MSQPDGHVPADMEGALLGLGIAITRTDDDEVWGHCPEHMERMGKEDRSASWSINRVTGVHNCFSCPCRGTLIDLVASIKFPHDIFAAGRWLRQFGVNLASAESLGTFDQRVTVQEPQEIVPETRLAMFNPDPPGWALDARELSLESCHHYNVRWNSEHDSWIIPVRHPEGSLVGWQEKWQLKRRFINWPKEMRKSLCLFGLDVFPVGEPAVLLESPLDVLKLYTAGYTGGLAFYGAAWSKEQMQLVLDRTDEAVVALDNDPDGRAYAEELRNGKYERGKLIKPGYSSRMSLRFFDYHNTGEKDIGGMHHSSITKGLYEAKHSVLVDLASEEQRENRRGIRGTFKAVPGARRQGNGAARSVPADRGGRGRKDSNDYRDRGRPRRGVR